MFQDPRKLNALILVGVGIILLNLSGGLKFDSDILMIAVSLIPVVGVICFILGIYRFATKGKSKCDDSNG